MKRILWLMLAFSTESCLGAELDLEKQCLDCHRPGQDRGEVPLIEGQHREYLRHQLLRFRDWHRQSFPMSTLVSGMDDAVLAALAATLQERAWRDAEASIAVEAARRGAAVAVRRDCASCHGVHFEGNGDIPRLAGQHPGYLARQIEGFGRGDRYHPPSGTGAPMRVIPPSEARDLAAFFSASEQASRDPGRLSGD